MIEIEYALAGFIFTGIIFYMIGYWFGHDQGRYEGAEIRDWHIRKVLNEHTSR